MKRQAGRRSTCGCWIVAAIGLAGCAGPRAVLQSIDIEAATAQGVAVPGARCTANLGGAEWTVAPPATLSVTSGRDELLVRCEAGALRGEARLAGTVQGGRGWRALVGGAAGGMVGGLLGAREDRQHRGDLCCKGLSQLAGTVVGAGVGAGIGAATADPRWAYPGRVRVLMQPAAEAPR